MIQARFLSATRLNLTLTVNMSLDEGGDDYLLHALPPKKPLQIS